MKLVYEALLAPLLTLALKCADGKLSPSALGGPSRRSRLWLFRLLKTLLVKHGGRCCGACCAELDSLDLVPLRPPRAAPHMHQSGPNPGRRAATLGPTAPPPERRRGPSIR